MQKALQRIGIISGIFLILNTIAVCFVSSLSLNNFIPAIVGIVILLYSILYKHISSFCSHGVLKLLHSLFKLGLIFFIVTFTICTALIYENSVREPPANADAIIVLGAGLRGTEAGLTLAHRLDAAVNYYEANPQSIILVSGGQGSNESVTEASAMKRYLLNNGVAEEKIIEEDSSSRTVENFEFSKVILDAHFKNRPYNVVYVTNGFHVFRAGMIAKQVGLDAYGLNAESVEFLAPTQYLCEYFSIIKYFVLDYK